MNNHTGIAPLSAPLLQPSTVKPPVLVGPETPAEHARNVLQFLQFILPNDDGTYTWTSEQMASLVFRLNRIAYGEQVETLRARVLP